MFSRKLSRRDVIGAAGALAVGAAVAKINGAVTPAEARTRPADKWPWPYVKLDPAETGELAYTEWYRVFCGAAVINSIFSQLSKKVGDPYRSFPGDGFIFLEGGMSGWGTICGSNAGANIVSNLIIGPRTSGTEDGMLMGSEMLQWYAEAALPVYEPKTPRIKAEIPKTTSNSPLCHISVGKWMQAANKSLGSPERRDRCARVTASVAYHVVELLNAWKDGKYVTKGTIPSKTFNITAQQNCSECHPGGIPTPPSPQKA